jgi:hypothetical protein
VSCGGNHYNYCFSADSGVGPWGLEAEGFGISLEVRGG